MANILRLWDQVFLLLLIFITFVVNMYYES